MSVVLSQILHLFVVNDNNKDESSAITLLNCVIIVIVFRHNKHLVNSRASYGQDGEGGLWVPEKGVRCGSQKSDAVLYLSSIVS